MAHASTPWLLCTEACQPLPPPEAMAAACGTSRHGALAWIACDGQGPPSQSCQTESCQRQQPQARHAHTVQAPAAEPSSPATIHVVCTVPRCPPTRAGIPGSTRSRLSRSREVASCQGLARPGPAWPANGLACHRPHGLHRPKGPAGEGAQPRQHQEHGQVGDQQRHQPVPDLYTRDELAGVAVTQQGQGEVGGLQDR